jgi:PAS domain S-box-containing protein
MPRQVAPYPMRGISSHQRRLLRHKSRMSYKHTWPCPEKKCMLTTVTSMSVAIRPARLILLSAIAVSTIALSTILLLSQLRTRELVHAEGETVSLSNIIAEQMTRSLQSVDMALRIAQDRLIEAERQGVSLDDSAIHAMLKSRVASMPHLIALFVVDSDGRAVNSSRNFPFPPIPVADRAYFEKLKAGEGGEIHIGTPTRNRVDEKWTLHLARRIRKLNGEFGGVIGAAIDLDYLETLYGTIKLDFVSPISLYLDDGTLVVRHPHEESLIGKKSLLPALPISGEKGFEPVTVRDSGEAPGITTFRSISEFPMVLAVGNRDWDALNGWRDSAEIIIADAVLAAILVLLATLLLLREQRREAKLATEALESGERLKAMVEAAMDAIVTIDINQRIVLFNPAAERMFGYSAAEMHGRSIESLLPERFRIKHQANITGFMQSGVKSRMKNSGMAILGLRADGTEFPVESTISQMKIGEQMFFTAILRDIGERRRAENRLRDSHQQLRDLAASLQTIREVERTSIARELHDELGQQLLRLRMDLSWLSSRIKDLSPVLHEKVMDMKHFIEGTVNAVRSVTTRLRPPVLDDLGLVEAMRWQLGEFERNTGIAVAASISVDDLLLDQNVATQFFRILQESLTNVARHAEASQVNVLFEPTDAGLHLEVRDNGRGAELSDGSVGAGHGLVGIRERVLMIDGKMEISSGARGGFAINIIVPDVAPKS